MFTVKWEFYCHWFQLSNIELIADKEQGSPKAMLTLLWNIDKPIYRAHQTGRIGVWSVKASGYVCPQIFSMAAFDDAPRLNPC